MIIDNKGKIFGKINIIDLLVIVLLIAAGTVVGFKYSIASRNKASTTNSEFIYSFKIDGVREYTINQIHAGDKVFDDESGKCIGTIEKVEKKPDRNYIVKSDGTFNIAERPDRYNAIVTIKATGAVNSGGHYAADGTKAIIPHSSITLSNYRFRASGKVLKIVKD